MATTKTQSDLESQVDSLKKRLLRDQKKLVKRESELLTIEQSAQTALSRAADQRAEIRALRALEEHVRAMVNPNGHDRRAHLEAHGWRIEGVKCRRATSQHMSHELALRMLVDEALEVVDSLDAIEESKPDGV